LGRSAPPSGQFHRTAGSCAEPNAQPSNTRGCHPRTYRTGGRGVTVPPAGAQPPRHCSLCPRLAAFREAQRRAHPEWFNEPVPPFGEAQAELLIVRHAQGWRVANRTGRSFTGDYAGTLLYATLRKYGFAEGHYDASADDGLKLRRVRITNAVRCVPPQNKPEPNEVANCRRFLADEISAVPGHGPISSVAAIAHRAGLTALPVRRALFPFEHGRGHDLPCELTLADSYH